MGRIIVIGMGSSNYSEFSEKGKSFLRSDFKKFARSNKHLVYEHLSKEMDIETFDYLYEQEEDIKIINNLIVEKLIAHSEKEDVIYLVPGSPFVLEESVEILISSHEDVEIINGQSAADLVFSRLRYVTDGYKTISGKDFTIHKVDFSVDYLIQEIDDEFILDEIILNLMDIYPPDSRFSIIKDGGLETEKIYSDKLVNYERKIVPNHQTSLLIYKNKESYDFSDLLETADTLRGPYGCPWDIEQTHESLRQDILEEAYEVVESIDKEDFVGLEEELGDLLFQVVLNSQIAYENGDFNIQNVINSVNNKLILRHPHVFGNLNLDKSSKVLQNWDSIKYSHRDINTFWERLDSSKGLPSTIRAYKIIDKVTRIGFDWNNRDQILDKVKEEYNEVVEALDNPQNLREELGDLLFTVSNLAHYLNFQPELLLTEACDKFVGRFKKMEEFANEEGLVFLELSQDELERLWQMSKH